MTTTSDRTESFILIQDSIVKNNSTPSSLFPLVSKWVMVSLSVYLLITAIHLISAGFSLSTGDYAATLFTYVDNVFIALSIGVLSTILTQSSSTTTSITVGLVASGMPLSIAIPILLGANIGTTVTNTLVALTAVPENKEDRSVFGRSFSAASVHDFFNVVAVAIFLPLELMFSILEKISGYLSSVFQQANGGTEDASSLLIEITSIISSIFSAFSDVLINFIVFSEENTAQGTFNGILIIILALALLIFSMRFISKTLGTLLVGKTKKVLDFAISHNSFTGVLSGALITSAVQSSSTTTSLAVPLVGSGSFNLKQIYPFMVGANIGTTATALLVGITMVGDETSFGAIALQAAFIHALFNIFAAIVIMIIPVLRSVPLHCAEWIGRLAVKNRVFAVLYTVGIFVITPTVILVITLFFP